MNKKSLAIILAVNIILLSTIVTLYFTIWKPNLSGEEGTITITGFIGQDLQFNITQLEGMPNITKPYTIQGTPTFTANFTGVSLYHLITVVANYSYKNIDVKIKGIDNYFSQFKMSEINETRDIILAYKMNGEYIKSGRKGGDGPLRLIVPQSYAAYNGLYCVKYATTIELIAGEGSYVTITGVIENDIELSLFDLENLTSITNEYIIQGSSTAIANYTGVSLYYLITEIAHFTNNDSNIVIKSIDDFSFMISFDEINALRDVILAYRLNGTYMDTIAHGGVGPLRLIVPQSYATLNYIYCVQEVVTIEIHVGE